MTEEEEREKIEFSTSHPDFAPTEDMGKLLLGWIWGRSAPQPSDVGWEALAGGVLQEGGSTSPPGSPLGSVGVTPRCHHALPLGLPTTDSAAQMPLAHANTCWASTDADWLLECRSQALHPGYQ